SWGDVEIKKGHYALTQPTIRPLFNTRQFQDALLKWTGNDVSYHDYIKEAWGTTILGGSSFNQALHDGVYVGSINAETLDTTSTDKVETTQDMQSGNAAQAMTNSAKSDGLELVLYAKTGMSDGQQANNPWLQEFPDPITRTTWDNYLTVAKA